MATLPKQYLDLLKEGAPKMLVEILNLFGTYEVPGSGDNPVILAWAKELGLQDIYKHDETAWCALLMAIAAKRAGKPLMNPISKVLWALNWADWGTRVTVGMLGDILIKKRFDRDGKLIGGHVTMIVGEDSNYYHCLGGNQSDSVSIVRIAKTAVYAIVRPHYNNIPANVRRIFRDPTGDVSTKEC